VPVEYDFDRNDRGRYLNTKDNVKGVLMLNNIDVRYNVVKKRMEIDMYQTQSLSLTCRMSQR
jgi:hypothetical protein